MKDFFKKVFTDESEKIITWKVWLFILVCNFTLYFLQKFCENLGFYLFDGIYGLLVLLHLPHKAQISYTSEIFAIPLIVLLFLTILFRILKNDVRAKNCFFYFLIYLFGVLITHLIIWFLIQPSLVKSGAIVEFEMHFLYISMIVFSVLGFIPNLKGGMKLFGKMWLIHTIWVMNSILYEVFFDL